MESNKRGIEVKIVEEDLATLKIIFFLKQGNLATDFPFAVFLWKGEKARMLVPFNFNGESAAFENYPVSFTALENLRKVDKGMYMVKVKKGQVDKMEMIWTSEGKIMKKKIKILENKN